MFVAGSMVCITISNSESGDQVLAEYMYRTSVLLWTVTSACNKDSGICQKPEDG